MILFVSIFTLVRLLFYPRKEDMESDHYYSVNIVLR